MKVIFVISLIISICFLSFNKAISQNTICLSQSWINIGSGLSLDTLDVPKVMVEHRGELYVITWNQKIAGYQLLVQGTNSWNWVTDLMVMSGEVTDMVSYKNELYISGTFFHLPGTIYSAGILKWNGIKWIAVSQSGMAPIHDMHIHKGLLYVAGSFKYLGGLTTSGIASYNGKSWSSLANGLPTNSYGIRTMVSYEGELIVGGSFYYPSTPAIQNIARWDGQDWHGFTQSPDEMITLLVVLKGNLIAYGPNVTMFGNFIKRHMASWDGNVWLRIEGSGDKIGMINDMLVMNDVLYMAGNAGSGHIGGKKHGGFLTWNGIGLNFITGISNTKPNDLTMHRGKLYVIGKLGESCGNILLGISRLCLYADCGDFSGRVYADINDNCIFDSTDIPYRDQIIQITPGNVLAITNENGYYYGTTDTGYKTFQLINLPKYHFLKCNPNGYVVNISDSLPKDSIDFPIWPEKNQQDLVITITSLSRARPGRELTYQIDYKNVGTLIMNGVVSLDHDLKLIYDRSNIPYSFYSGNNMEWMFSGLKPYENRKIKVTFTISRTIGVGYNIIAEANIDPVLGDLNPVDNYALDKIVVTGSYDPNDKTVSPNENGIDGGAHWKTKTLTYTIRFQNTGNDTAFDVKIQDQIEMNLSFYTIQTIAASHNYTMRIEPDRLVEWEFSNILLPDSFVDEQGSHGFVKFSIDLIDSLPMGTKIENKAGIIFDFNTPIITNLAQTTLVSSIREPKDPGVLVTSVYPNPFSINSIITTSNNLNNGTLIIYDLYGRVVRKITDLNGTSISISRGNLGVGVFIYQIIDGDGTTSVGKFIVQ